MLSDFDTSTYDFLIPFQKDTLYKWATFKIFVPQEDILYFTLFFYF